MLDEAMTNENMSHHCTHALVRCMDFRLEKAIEKYLIEQNLVGTIDVISVAGAAKDLVAHPEGFVATQIDLSKKLHESHTIILMNHTDCGGYGGRDALESDEAEHDFHLKELEKGKQIILAKYPDLTVKKVLAKIKGETVEFEELN
ncbi:MAG: carbonic anhydrase [Patescibacteria group bacterium]